jgi:RND family efflux transporter MFP subunit
MSEVEAKSQPENIGAGRDNARPPDPAVSVAPGRRWHIVPMLITLAAVLLAGLLGRSAWDAYVAAPWTRDGTVRAYVVTMAPEVSGRIVSLPVADNQFVRKDDVLMTIDPTDYTIAVGQAQAALEQARASAENAEHEAQRRARLTDLETSQEEAQTYATNAVAAAANQRQAEANLAHARVNLERTSIRSPVNGWVTNLLAQTGDYATAGQNMISVVNADSFWVDGYFEETAIAAIHAGDRAEIKLLGHPQVLRGHVDSIARAISVNNAQPNAQGVATVNPIFTWVRLAQRIPVRIHIDEVPNGITLAAGMTATVQIDPGMNAAPTGQVR